jgi:tRNA modification GTPase
VRQTIQLEGVPMNIIDTAGLRDTADKVESLGIARTWDALEGADVLLLVVDARAGVTEADRAILGRLPGKLKRVIVFNKIDLAGRTGGSARDDGGWRVHLSAKTGEGIDLLRKTLLSLAGWQSTGEDIFMARERQLSALARAADALGRAKVAMAQSELFAEELRLAQQELNAITGEFTADDLLGEIFSRFCIGK